MAQVLKDNAAQLLVECNDGSLKSFQELSHLHRDIAPIIPEQSRFLRITHSDLTVWLEACPGRDEQTHRVFCTHSYSWPGKAWLDFATPLPIGHHPEWQSHSEQIFPMLCRQAVWRASRGEAPRLVAPAH